MASSPIAIEVIESPAAAAPKLAIVPLIVAVVAAVIVSVLLLGGGAYYLVRSGRLALPGAATPVTKAAPVVVTTTHALVLEPVVVNLADTGGKTYLRVALTLRVLDAEKKDAKPKEEKAKETPGTSDAEAAVRDTTLDVMGRQTAEGLLAPNGKELLKTALKSALSQRNPELKVTEVFFTEFLVQQ